MCSTLQVKEAIPEDSLTMDRTPDLLEKPLDIPSLPAIQTGVGP